MKTEQDIFETATAAHLIAECEALHRRRLAEIAGAITAAHDGRNVRMVLVAGPSSSGKTTFSRRLCAALEGSGLKPVQISIDNYFVNREDTPRDEEGKYDFEAVEAVDLALLNDQLQRMIAGEEVRMPSFNFVEGRREWQPEVVVPGEDTIFVMEGLHALNPRLTSLVDDGRKFRIYIAPLSSVEGDDGREATPFDMRLVRRITRDNAHRGRTAAMTLEEWASVRRGEERYVFPFRETADASFDSSLRYELRVLRPLVEPLIRSVDSGSRVYGEAKRLLGLLSAFEPFSAETVPADSILQEFLNK